MGPLSGNAGVATGQVAGRYGRDFPDLRTISNDLCRRCHVGDPRGRSRPAQVPSSARRYPGNIVEIETGLLIGNLRYQTSTITRLPFSRLIALPNPADQPVRMQVHIVFIE